MTITIHGLKRHLSGMLLALICLMTSGCLLESTFSLAKESRLPNWITLPPGLTRADVSLEVNFYTVPFGNDTRFILLDKNERTLEKKSGRALCQEPLQLKNPPQGVPAGYPKYIVVVVGGMTEIFEQTKPGDILFVTDNIAIWKQYREIGCG
jgi:hypothetical protein